MPPRSSINKHHLHWEAREYKRNGILNRLRDHQGMIIPMNLYDHRELHADLKPTPKPTSQQAEELLSHLGRYDPTAERIDYIDMAVNYMRDVNPQYTGHLLVQRAYVLLTPFSQVERDIIEQEREEYRYEQPA